MITNMNRSPSILKSTSESSASANQRNNILFNDQIFPFFEQITSQSTLPSFFYSFVALLIAWQTIYVSFWANSNPLWETKNFDIMNIFSIIATFNPISKSQTDSGSSIIKTDPTINNLILFGVLTGLLLLSAMFFVFQFIWYKNYRRFNIMSLYPTKLFMEIIAPICCLPCANLISIYFDKIGAKHSKAEDIVIFIISIVDFVAFASISVLSYKMIGSSAYLPQNIFAAFNISPFTYSILFMSCFLMFFNIFEKFPSYVRIAVVVLHLIGALVIISSLIYRPFISLSANVLFMAIFINCCLMDIMYFVVIALKFTNDVILYSVWAVIMVLSFVVTIIFYSIQTKIMKKNLKKVIEEYDDIVSNSGKASGADEQMNLSFLKLERSESKALLYLEFIISNAMKEYLFSIFSYILALHNSRVVTMRVLRLFVFFPSESRYLSVVLRNLYQHRKFSISERFLIFQVQRIKTFRMSTSSNSAAERIHELSQVTRDLEGYLKSFWLGSVNQIGYLKSVSKELRKAEALWEESMSEFPNSTIFGEERIRFLVECSTDFSAAIREKHHVELIECGSHSYKDRCFKLFARMFPKYLKNRILDVHGNVIRQNKKQKGSHSTNGTGSNGKISVSTTSSGSDLDVTVEEGIGKTLLTRAKTRLALQHATEKRRANSFSVNLLTHFALMMCGLAIFVFIYVYFDGYFNNRKDNMIMIANINMIRLYLFSSQLTLFAYWGRKKGVTPLTQTNTEAQAADRSNNSFFPFKELDKTTMAFQIMTKKCYEDLVNTVATLSKNGVNVYEAAMSLFEPITDMKFCDDNANPKYTYQMNLKGSLIYQLSMTLVMVADTDMDNWFKTNNYYCSMTASMFSIGYPLREIRTTMSTMIIQDSLSCHDLIQKMTIIIPIIYIVLCITSTLVVSLIYRNEIVQFMKMLHAFPDDAKKEATGLLIKDDDEADSNKDEDSSGHAENECFFITFCILVIMFYIVIAIIMLMELINIQDYNNKFKNMNVWNVDSTLRSSLVSELTLWIYFSASIKNPLMSTSKFMSLIQLGTNIDLSYNSLDTTSKNILSESNGYPSMYGLDDEIDRLMLKENCVPNQTSASFHEMYHCGSSQQLVTFFLNTVLQTMSRINEYNGVIDDEVTSQLMHMLSTHINPSLLLIDDRLKLLLDQYISEYQNIHIIYLVAGFIVSILTLIVAVFYIKELNKCYNIALILLRRLSPISITNQIDLLNYLLGKSKESSSSEMSVDQNIIFSSADSIICMGNNMLIDFINPAVSKTFGFSPEQLLGQSIMSVFSDSSKDLFENQIQLMLNRQSSLSYEGHVTCVADDDNHIPCSMTILAIEGDDSKIESFVVILRDESQLLAQQNEAEQCKKESETLLYQILPRDIVNRINQGEKDISFSVPSATVMFIDIVKFSEYSASLTPQEIMGNLSMIFCGFDEVIVKYHLLLKIKLIGDVYMVAGGLFSPDEPPQSHAEQMVRFGLECLQILEDTNVKLNAVLNVRIGINTGGPLIAGVLGSDKPTFDIIGDPINVASRLQSTDIASHIQISQNTYELVRSLDFQIEPRGEIFLKGKGNMPAYIVSMNRAYMFQVSSSDQEIKNDSDMNNANEINNISVSINNSISANSSGLKNIEPL